ncbi:MAG TPA: aminotransferase class V-fold PLP-dependent enzyme [Polyangia bacterium]|nr:aminotransferase class V-fold PLP-dependent enzyme [Polyangia bacterium]
MIYLDHAALAPMPAAVVGAMTDAARDAWGNPDSVHAAGRRARARLEQARAEIAALLGAPPGEIRLATRGGQALERAIRLGLERRAGALALTPLEHPSILRIAERAGRPMTWLPARAGRVDAAASATALRHAAVVVVSALNHELGTLVDLAAVRAAAPQAWLVVDAVQAAPWIDLRPLRALDAIVVVAAQKLGGPPGAAALRLPETVAAAERAEAELESAGWLAAIGFGEACRLARLGGDGRRAPARRQGERLRDGIRAVRPDAVFNGAPESWGGPILNVSFPGYAATEVTGALDLAGVCVARGSACLRRTTPGSPVVAAAYPDDPWRAVTATRWSVGVETTDDQIDRACATLARVLAVLPFRGDLAPAARFTQAVSS